MPSYESWVEFHQGTDSFDFDYAEAGLDELQRLIPDKVGKAIKDELNRVAGLAKSSLLGEPTHGEEHTGLRARIASRIKVESVGDRAEISVSAPDTDEAGIPWGLDSASKGWHHPVFGREDDWVLQKGSVPWWSGPTKQIEPALRERIPEAIDDAVDDVFE